MTTVVWTVDTFGNNFGINCKFKRYLKESCGLYFDHHFSFKYFLKIPSDREISPHYSGGLGTKGVNGSKLYRYRIRSIKRTPS